MLTHLTDHDARALARLAYNLHDSTTHQGIQIALAQQVQAIEDASWTLFTLRQIDLAVGVQLDQIGEIVGRARGGSDDQFYRQQIKATVLINRGSGTHGLFVQILQLLLPTATIGITEVTPVNGFNAPAVIISISDVLVQDIGPYIDLLNEAKAAGLTILVTYQGIPDDQAFTFDGAGGLGFGDLNDPSVGGKFVGATR